MPRTLAKPKPLPLPQPLRAFSPTAGAPVDVALKMDLTSSYREIPRLREWIGHLNEIAAIAPVALFEFRLAAIETFIHMVEYAYQGDEHGVIKATLLVRGLEVRLVLRDYGQKIVSISEDRNRVPDGKGSELFLIQRLADEVKFHASLPRGTAVEIMKRLDPVPGGEDPHGGPLGLPS
jgi:anti-sigma regulatory factor (Ser/Thr protein kinase)